MTSVWSAGGCLAIAAQIFEACYTQAFTSEDPPPWGLGRGGGPGQALLMMLGNAEPRWAMLSDAWVSMAFIAFSAFACYFGDCGAFFPIFCRHCCPFWGYFGSFQAILGDFGFCGPFCAFVVILAQL